MDGSTSHCTFVSYIDRSRDYYGAQGFDRAYAWAHHEDVPFAPLAKPLSECRVGLLTTSYTLDNAPTTRGADKQPYAAAAHPPEAMYTDDLAWDRDATHTDDVETFLPLRRLGEMAAAGRIGAASPRFYGVPTEYSHRRTTSTDAPRIVEWCREDGVDVLVLVPI